MQIAVFTIIVFHCYCTVFSQVLRRPVSPQYPGLGAYSKLHVDAFSFTANQASLAQVKSAAGGVYGEKRFLLSAANLYTAVITLPTKEGNFGFQADYFGFTDYNESQIGIAYARSVGSRLDIGVKFNYYSFKIPGYANGSAVNFELGAIAHLTEKLHAGIHVFNPVGVKLSKQNDEKLSSSYTFGIGYEASGNFFISTEIIKEEDQGVNVNAGLQYNFVQQFFVRAGIATEISSSYAGLGLSWKNFRLDVSGSYHPQLGFTPGVLLIVNSRKNQQ